MTTALRLQTTRIYEANAAALLSGKRRALNEGGTYSSKTWSILQLLILVAQSAKKRLLISVVSESLPHLKRGAIRDLFRILDESPENNPRYNKTEQTYTFGNGIIEFFGADESDKVRGPRRDILFINEANNVPWETARGLDIRTNRFTFADWNPVSSFWAHEYWIGQEENAYIHSTYQDALPVISQAVVQNILATGERDPNWANVYVYGRLGKVEGLVYPVFGQVKELPYGEVFYGLDFGFSTDVTALVKNVIVDDALYSQQLIYERGLTNQDIAVRMAEAEVVKHVDEIFADSAEPKSIEEIHQFGFNIKPCPKGPGSVEYGHQKVRQYRQFWTDDSLDCIKEQRNFRYMPDKDGRLTDKTTHLYSHGMDARRYAIMGKAESREEEKVVIYDAMENVRGLDLEIG
jgi:phage terminase large subunit